MSKIIIIKNVKITIIIIIITPTTTTQAMVCVFHSYRKSAFFPGPFSIGVVCMIIILPNSSSVKMFLLNVSTRNAYRLTLSVTGYSCEMGVTSDIYSFFLFLFFYKHLYI